MAEHQHRDRLGADAAGRAREADAPAGDTDLDQDTTVERVVHDVREGVDRVAEKVKGLLRSHR